MHRWHVSNSQRPVAVYSLDVIISAGYRVKSRRCVEFRRWATDVLKRYILKGHAENEERLRQFGEAVKIIERLPGELASREILDIVESLRMRTSCSTPMIAKRCRVRKENRRHTFSTTMNAWGLSCRCIPVLPAILSAAKRTIRFEAALRRFTSRMEAWSSALHSRRRRRTFCISSSRTIRSSTVTSESPAASSCTFSIEMDPCFAASKSVFRTACSWLWRSWLQGHALRRRSRWSRSS